MYQTTQIYIAECVFAITVFFVIMFLIIFYDQCGGKQSTSVFHIFNILYMEKQCFFFNGCYGYDNIREAMIALMTMMMTNNHDDDDDDDNDDNGDDEDGLAGKALCCIVMAVVADLSVT